MFIFTPQLQSLHSCRISSCSLPDKKKKNRDEAKSFATESKREKKTL